MSIIRTVGNQGKPSAFVIMIRNKERYSAIAKCEKKAWQEAPMHFECVDELLVYKGPGTKPWYKQSRVDWSGKSYVSLTRIIMQALLLARLDCLPSVIVVAVLSDATQPLLRASRKAYCKNSFFQSYVKVLHPQQDICLYRTGILPQPLLSYAVRVGIHCTGSAWNSEVGLNSCFVNNCKSFYVIKA